MAGIDKIYCDNRRDFKEFYDWCSMMLELCRKDTALNIMDYFYSTPDEWDDKIHPFGVPITIFPERIDMWLWKHCPVSFVRERLMEQYNKLPKNIELYLHYESMPD